MKKTGFFLLLLFAMISCREKTPEEPVVVEQTENKIEGNCIEVDGVRAIWAKDEIWVLNTGEQKKRLQLVSEQRLETNLAYPTIVTSDQVIYANQILPSHVGHKIKVPFRESIIVDGKAVSRKTNCVYVVVGEHKAVQLCRE